MLLDRATIAARIPHAGRMCLLDGVLRWDADGIACVSRSQSQTDHPLRVGEVVPVLVGIEYAAQAMAMHGALTALEGARPRAGYLAALRDVRCARERLDDIGEMMVEATRMMGDAANVIYEFRLTAAGAPILSGRATVILDAGRQ